MGIINFFINLLKDPRTAIASWIAMGVAPTLGFIFLIVFIEKRIIGDTCAWICDAMPESRPRHVLGIEIGRAHV